MQRAQILEEVEARMRIMHGLRHILILDEEWRKKIIELEHEDETEEAMVGLMKMKNVGIWECFKRQEQMMIVVDKDAIILRLAKNLLQISDSHGHIIGEWVNEARIGEYAKDPDAIKIGEDFILYPDRKIEGEPYFIIPEVGFPFLYGTTGIKNITSGSPSKITTEFVLSSLKMEKKGLWTHLVGFDLESDRIERA